MTRSRVIELDPVRLIHCYTARHCEERSDEAIHMWTAPASQGLTGSFLDRIACVHMSGLLGAVVHDRWPRWFPRREFHTEARRRASLDCPDCLPSRIDRSTICSFSCKVRPRRDVRGCPRLAPPISLSGCRRRGQRAPGVIDLAGRHQLPGDAGDLVGERHGSELGWLALQELDQPG